MQMYGTAVLAGMATHLSWGKRSPHSIEAAKRAVNWYWENHRWLVRWWEPGVKEWRVSEPMSESEAKAQVKTMREAIRRGEREGKVW